MIAKAMRAICTDPAKDMRRFYRLDVQPDLFGQWCHIRVWGRIGSAGEVRMVPFATATEAQEALAHHRRVKERRDIARRPGITSIQTDPHPTSPLYRH
jgi:predicted DNA-binding WGR domain protein